MFPLFCRIREKNASKPFPIPFPKTNSPSNFWGHSPEEFTLLNDRPKLGWGRLRSRKNCPDYTPETSHPKIAIFERRYMLQTIMFGIQIHANFLGWNQNLVSTHHLSVRSVLQCMYNSKLLNPPQMEPSSDLSTILNTTKFGVSNFHLTVVWPWAIWVFRKIGVPQHGWLIMENHFWKKWFGGTTIFGNIHIISSI